MGGEKRVEARRSPGGKEARRPAPKKGGLGLEAYQGCETLGEAQRPIRAAEDARRGPEGKAARRRGLEGKGAAVKEEAEGKEVKETENMLLE